jgi:N-acetylmuramoyl-L-alanine amidase
VNQVLRAGATGPEVLALRASLGQAARAAQVASGAGSASVFDNDLELAVRAFQQRRGLLIDGVVGPQTHHSLEAARWQLGDRILMHTPGHLMRGDDVAALQERLVVLGLLHARVDSVFGPETEAALGELQRSLGLEPDGLCGPSTLRGLAAVRRSVVGGDPWAPA